MSRASLEELKEFANAVREAGGGNPIDALMPAVPQDSSQCLIARNLNFNCVVQQHEGDLWQMVLQDEAIRDSIAKKLDLETIDYPATKPLVGAPEKAKYGVVLPEEIGKVAYDFDSAEEIINTISASVEDATFVYNDKTKVYDDVPLTPERIAEVLADVNLSEESKALVEEMWPYIEEATKEAYGLASIVTEDGRIVL